LYPTSLKKGSVKSHFVPSILDLAVVLDNVHPSLFLYLNGVRGLLANAADKTIDSNLDSLPTLIAVHGVVAASDGGQLSKVNLVQLVEQLLHVSSGGAGGGVATVAKEVDEDLGDLGLLGGIKQGEEVVHVTVDTTIRDLFLKTEMFLDLFIAR
jgi:hypothetical protein